MGEIATSGIRYGDESIFLKGVRLAWPHIGKPYRPSIIPTVQYSATLMLPKDRIHSARLIFGAEKKLLQGRTDTNVSRGVLRDGDFVDDGRLHFEEGRGHWIIATRAVCRPYALGRQNELLNRDEAESLFYPGVWANVLIEPKLVVTRGYG